MPMVFVYPITYLMEYTFTFNLLHVNSQLSRTVKVNSSSERHATDIIRRDREINTVPHFIVPLI